MDKFEGLRAFTQVVEAGGFAAAARGMGLSRSAVNKLVINLENELGVQLLHRSTRRVSTTEMGRAFYDRCVQILADLEEAERSLSQLHQEPRGILKMNAPMSFGVRHLAPAVLDFMAQYPDLQVQLILEDRFVDPIQEGYDLVLRIAQPSDSASLIVHELAPAHRVLCASPDYLEQRGEPVTPSDLSHHSCLHYGYLATGTSWRLADQDQDYVVSVNGLVCSNNGDVLRDAAVRGFGIALLPVFLVEQDLASGKLVSVLTSYLAPPISISVVYPVNRHLSAKVQLMTEFLRARFASA